jgi:hypothetical protein
LCALLLPGACDACPIRGKAGQLCCVRGRDVQLIETLTFNGRCDLFDRPLQRCSSAYLVVDAVELQDTSRCRPGTRAPFRYTVAGCFCKSAAHRAIRLSSVTSSTPHRAQEHLPHLGRARPSQSSCSSLTCIQAFTRIFEAIASATRSCSCSARLWPRTLEQQQL